MKTNNMKRLQNWSFWALTFLSVSLPAQAVNIYLRGGSTTCIYNGVTSLTLQKTSGSSQMSTAFTARTNTFSFYSAPLTATNTLATGKKIGGIIGVQNNG